MRPLPVLGVAAVLFLAQGCLRAGFAPNAGQSDASSADALGPDLDPHLSDGDAAPDGPSDSATADVPCFFQAPAFAQLTPLRTVHVARSGDDTTGNGTVDRPLATLARALEEVAPGVAIRLHEGSYEGTALVGLRGSATAPIWIGGEPHQPPPQITGGLSVSMPRYLVLHDLEIPDSPGVGLHVEDGNQFTDPEAARYVALLRLHVHHTKQDASASSGVCIKLSGLDDFWLLDSLAEACAGFSGIDLVGCHKGVVAQSTVMADGSYGIIARGGSEAVDLRANRVLPGAARGIVLGGITEAQSFRPPLATDALAYEARNVRAIANEILRSESGVAFVSSRGCAAINNTIFEPQQYVLRILQEHAEGEAYTFGATSLGTVINNLVVYSRATTKPLNIGIGTDAASFSFAHNLWYAPDDPLSSAPVWTNGLSEIGGVVGQDPQLTDPFSDCSIPQSSPAAGAGQPLAGLGGDVMGRCFADPPSIGAHEVAP